MTLPPSTTVGLDALEERVRAAVARRRAGERGDAELRGLYISEDDVDELLGGASPGPNGDGPPAGAILEDRLRLLAAAFRLEPIDVELLLVAVAPDLDSRFERLYGYLHDDVTRRRPSIGLALQLAGAAATKIGARRRLVRGSPLVDGGLVVVENGDRPFLTRSLRVPDRVALHLLGDDRPDHVLAELLVPCPATSLDGSSLSRAIGHGAWLCYLREPPGGAALALGGAAFRSLGSGTLALDLSRIASGDDVAEIALAAGREARLVNAGIVAGPIESLLELGASKLRLLAEIPWPLVLTGARTWDPTWSRKVPLLVDLAPLSVEEREQLWRAQLDPAGADELDSAKLTTQFRLRPEQVVRAATAARLRAAADGRAPTVDDLRAGARSQNAAGLERLARRIEPAVDWSDLVLPSEILGHLRELAVRARYRDRVLVEWRMGGSRGTGVTALFSGESGTGKTMGAEVLAADLGLDLYAIDLATVVDKYVGETEKNLDRIFVEAEQVNGVIFFDEADALFGKRSDVQDARDRYANIEVAYLLQRMERFDGIAILATNLRANLDDAFTRRLDALIDFPMPDEEQRRRLWDHCLGTRVPRGDDLDLDFCAAAFDLSGGNIRNVAVAAAFRAADSGRPVSMADLIHGTKREYRKLGRLCLEQEFGRYFDLVSDD